MIVVEPPETPPALVQNIERPLIECGLNRDRIRIIFSAERQRIEIHVPAPSGATADILSCLMRGKGLGRFIFEEDSIQHAYSAMLKLYLDASYQAAAEILKNEGKLERLPKRTGFSSDTDFAQALEGYCGYSPGTVVQVQGGSTVLYPPDTSKPLSEDELESARCITSVFTLTALEKDSATWRDIDAEFNPIHNENEE